MARNNSSVTGYSGFLGTHLCKCLVAQGADVIGVSRRNNALSSSIPKFETVSLDLSNPANSRALVVDFEPAVVYHLAGNISAVEDKDLLLPMFHDNLATTVYLLEALTRSQCHRVITIGTIEELGLEGIPTSPYAASKLGAQMYATFFRCHYDLPLVQMRLNLAYGPGQGRSKFIPYVINTYLEGKTPVLGTPDRSCDFIYVDDVVSALLLACEQDSRGTEILEIGSGSVTSLFDVAEKIRQLLGKEIKPGSLDFPNRKSGDSKSKYEDNKRQSWGWRAQTSLDEGLRRTIEWYKEEGQMP